MSLSHVLHSKCKHEASDWTRRQAFAIMSALVAIARIIKGNIQLISYLGLQHTGTNSECRARV